MVGFLPIFPISINHLPTGATLQIYLWGVVKANEC